MPHVVTRPRRALLGLGAASPSSDRHSERGPGFRGLLCATATVHCGRVVAAAGTLPSGGKRGRRGQLPLDLLATGAVAPAAVRGFPSEVALRWVVRVNAAAGSRAARSNTLKSAAGSNRDHRYEGEP